MISTALHTVLAFATVAGGILFLRGLYLMARELSTVQQPATSDGQPVQMANPQGMWTAVFYMICGALLFKTDLMANVADKMLDLFDLASTLL